MAQISAPFVTSGDFIITHSNPMCSALMLFPGFYFCKHHWYDQAFLYFRLCPLSRCPWWSQWPLRGNVVQRWGSSFVSPMWAAPGIKSDLFVKDYLPKVLICSWRARGLFCLFFHLSSLHSTCRGQGMQIHGCCDTSAYTSPIETIVSRNKNGSSFQFTSRKIFHLKLCFMW